MNILEKLENYLNEASRPYVIHAGGGVTELYSTPEADSPKEAVELWVKLQSKTPLDVWLFAANPRMAQKLITWAQNNLVEVEKILKKQKAYKAEYLIDRILKIKNVSQSSDFRDYLRSFELNKQRKSDIKHPKERGITKKNYVFLKDQILVEPFTGG